ncbi:MAG: type I methionyl aminopeptidase [Desulfobulbus sp.]
MKDPYSYNRDSITVKTPEELVIMRRANKIVADVLLLLEKYVLDGTSTYVLDKVAEEYCRDHHARPAFKGYRGFPGTLCTSINNEVVHGIPSKKRILHNGDIVSIDFGVVFKGFFGDAAVTLPVGEISSEVQRLLDVTKVSLWKGIEQVRVNNRVSDISRAVQNYVESHGFSVVRQFVGHGIGSQLHEPPDVPNYVQQNTSSPRLVEGMTLAIEPMVNLGTERVNTLKDGWTVVTADGKPSAHFEHTVAVTNDGPLVLSVAGTVEAPLV